ncbi:hypothetical protein LCGC14_2887220 [marine sediment metagenome]|uniref:Uncharacterized protein n=1 Tax=marine sediment metagenome TaxID=412755 RepID=A0A0F8XYC5_9ZZZZ
MRAKKIGNTIKIWISANDTYAWAHKIGKCWPCSTLSGKRVFAEFDDGDLIDITINGKSNFDCDAYELNIMIADFMELILKLKGN